MAQKTIWCLNAAIDIVGPNQETIKAAFGEDNIKFGSRPQSKTQIAAPAYETNNLMPGCEYFVPIAPKCIGSDFLKPDSGGYLQQIQKYYKDKGQEDYKYFWSDDCRENRGYQMITDGFQGYYSLLKATKPNILIGYSQGGLVARYLEWLDKVVYNNAGVISGVITVSSPNFGSPLANVENKAYILKGLLKIGLILTTGMEATIILDGLADVVYGLLSLEGDPLTEIVHVMGGIIKDLQKEGDKFKNLINHLQSLINWMGGLRNDPDDAFFDLNINSVDEKNSILASVNSVDSSSRYGILSANNKVEDILHPESIGIIQQKVKSALNAKIGENSCYANVNNYVPAQNVKIEDKHFNKIEQIYDNQIMVEHLTNTPKNPIINQIIGDYKNGIKELKVDAKAHDFIIPSAYQQTFQNKLVNTDRNQVNLDANHLTGSSVKYKAGNENFDYIMDKLREIMKNS